MKLFKAKYPHWIVFAVEEWKVSRVKDNLWKKASEALIEDIENKYVDCEIHEIKDKCAIPNEWELDNIPYGANIKLETFFADRAKVEVMRDKLVNKGWEIDDDFVDDVIDILADDDIDEFEC